MYANLKRISIAVGMLAALASGSATSQAQTANANQSTADAVARALNSSPALRGQKIAIEARDGLVVLRGAVSSPAQHFEAMNRAKSVAGVTAVQDFVKVGVDSQVRRTQYQMAMHGGGMLGHGGGYAGAPGAPGMAPGAMMNGAMVNGGTVVDNPGGPMPEGEAGYNGETQAAMPGMPNYAWPSYAPYPNFSAVGYPTVYPWQAWPNIGPFYPYPEVPLDWRAVTLRWDDGLWWLDFKKHYTRPFFTPYPFGIFGY